MLDVTLAPVLFILFYLFPGAVLLSNTFFKGKRLENVALAVLLSLIFAPLTFTLFSRVFPGNDSLLLAGFISFRILFAAGVGFYPQTLKERLPDFGSIPTADGIAWLGATLLAAIVVSIRLGIIHRQLFQIVVSPGLHPGRTLERASPFARLGQQLAGSIRRIGSAVAAVQSACCARPFHSFSGGLRFARQHRP